MSESIRVCFAFFQRASIAELRYVIDRLHETHPEWTIEVLQGIDPRSEFGIAEEPIETVNMQVQKLQDFVSDEMEAHSWQATSLLKETFKTGLAAFASMKGDAVGLLAPLITEQLNSSRMHQVFLYYEQAKSAFRRFLTERKPQIVILPEEREFLRGAFASQLCRQMKIPTAVWFSHHWELLPTRPWVGSGIAECYVVTDESLIMRLKTLGVPPERIFLTHRVQEGGSRVTKAVPPIFFFPLQGKMWERTILQGLFATVAELSDCRIIIKTHPDVECHWIEKWKSSAGDRIRIIEDGDINGLLCEASAVLGQDSIILHRALKVGLPVIELSFSGMPSLLTSSESAMARQAKNLRELHLIMEDIIRAGAQADNKPHKLEKREPADRIFEKIITSFVARK